MTLPRIKIVCQKITWSDGQVVTTYTVVKETCFGAERIVPYNYKTIWTLKEAKQIRLYYCKYKQFPPDNSRATVVERHNEHC